MARNKRRKSAGRKTGKVYAPPQGDIGPDTPAQRAGADVVHRQEDNSAQFQQKVRSHLLQRMHKRGTLNARQTAAGLELHSRHEATMTSPDLSWTRCYVQSSPRPGDVNVAQLEAKGRYIALSAVVPRRCLAVVRAVCLYEVPLRPGFTKSRDRELVHRENLRTGLDAIADALRM